MCSTLPNLPGLNAHLKRGRAPEECTAQFLVSLRRDIDQNTLCSHAPAAFAAQQLPGAR